MTAHEQVRGRTRRNTVKAIVAKGPDRNDIERKFITGLGKLGLAAQEDGTVQKSETAVADAEGSQTHKRQQPKRQTKAKRQTTGATAGGAKETESSDTGSKTSLEKQDAPQDDKPKSAGKPASGSSRQAKSGQRKGPQRPKHPSKK
ncbi:cobalamin biosynthesis Mg chelatase CobN [Streptomyces sp. HB372]|nr:cobalamin biosynthesis Mg chelatase CobN [Streptomyces sp. HB372]